MYNSSKQNISYNNNIVTLVEPKLNYKDPKRYIKYGPLRFPVFVVVFSVL